MLMKKKYDKKFCGYHFYVKVPPKERLYVLSNGTEREMYDIFKPSSL